MLLPPPVGAGPVPWPSGVPAGRAPPQQKFGAFGAVSCTTGARGNGAGLFFPTQSPPDL